MVPGASEVVRPGGPISEAAEGTMARAPARRRTTPRQMNCSLGYACHRMSITEPEAINTKE